MIRTLFRDSIIYTIPLLVSRGIAIFLVPLYTRVLSPGDYGVLDMLMTFGILVNLTVPLEISQGVARHYVDEEVPQKKVQYASTAFWFTVFSYTFFLVVTIFLAPLLAKVIIGRDGLDSIFRLGMGYIWANGIFYLVQNQFRWELRSKQYAICSLLLTLATAFISVVLAYGLNWGLDGLLWGMLGGAIAGCVYGISQLRESFQLVFNFERLKEMLIFSLPLVPSGIAVFVNQYIDRLMINYFLTLDSLGLYGVGFRIASISWLVMVGFQGALTPLIYTNYRSPDTPEQIARIFRSFLFFALMLFYFLSVFANETLRLLTTSEYYAASELVVLLVPAILLSNMYIFAPGIFIAKKTHLTLWINVAGALAHACLNYVLIPRFGIQGAGLATLFGHMLVFIAYLYFSQKLYPVSHNWHVLGMATVVVIVGIVGANSFFFDMMINLFLKSALGILLALLLIKIRLVTFEEFISAVQSVRRLLVLGISQKV